MGEFFESLTVVEKIFFFCGSVGGLLFVIKTILQFFGADGEADVGEADIGDLDGDFGGDSDTSFTYLSFHSLTAFFMMFGIVGLAMSKESHFGTFLSVLGAALAGFFTMWIITRLFTMMKKLQSSGTLKMENAVGQEGTVYLRIPAESTGKVQIALQGNLMTLDAVSENKEEIKNGERVRVVRVVSGSMLAVEKIGDIF